MSYLDKYIKYKTKYIELKEILEGGEGEGNKKKKKKKKKE